MEWIKHRETEAQKDNEAYLGYAAGLRNGYKCWPIFLTLNQVLRF